MLFTLLQLFTLIALGFLLARFFGWSRHFFRSLSSFLVKVALPLYFVTRISRTRVQDLQVGLYFPLVALLVITLGVALSWASFTLFGYRGWRKRSGIALGGFGNSGILPLAVIEFLPVAFPPITQHIAFQTSVLYIGAYLLIQSPLLWSLGNYLIAGSGKRPRLRELLSPPLIGIVTGFLILLSGLQGPIFNRQLPFHYLFLALERIGGTAYPLILTCLGSMMANIRFAPGRNSELLPPALLVLLTRFLFLPLLFFAAFLLLLKELRLSATFIWVLFLETHVPPATNLAIMASQAGSRTGPGSSVSSSDPAGAPEAGAPEARAPEMEREDQVSFTLLLTYCAYLVVFPLFLLLFLGLSGIFG